MNLNGIGWERSVIGTVLADTATMEIAIDLAPQDFTGSHRTIWRHAVALHQRSALEPRALIEALRAAKELDELGMDLDNEMHGEDYLRFCFEFRGGQIEEYVRQVAENATRKQLREAAALIAADCVDGEATSDDLLDEAERRIMALRRTRTTTGATIGQITSAFMHRMDGMRSGDIKPAFEVRLQALKDVVTYIDQSDFVLIAGRPGDGKSSYLRFEAFYKAKQGVPGLIFNLENTEIEYAKGFISLDTGIDSVKLRDPRRLSRNELERVKRSAQGLMDLPLEIMTLGSPSVAEIERIARAKMNTLRPQYIMVDYVQLIHNGLTNPVHDVSLSSQTLKAMTMKNRLNVPIISAAQLSRAIERRGRGSAPELSDLRESGSLEQDATIVVFPRSEWNDPGPQEISRFPENVDTQSTRLLPTIRAVPMRFYVRKNRNGPVGVTDEIKWCMHTGAYYTLRREE